MARSLVIKATSRMDAPERCSQAFTVAPLTDLLATVVSGGTVTLCRQCAARRGITGADVIPGIRIAGTAGRGRRGPLSGAGSRRSRRR